MKFFTLDSKDLKKCTDGLKQFHGKFTSAFRTTTHALSQQLLQSLSTAPQLDVYHPVRQHRPGAAVLSYCQWGTAGLFPTFLVSTGEYIQNEIKQHVVN